MKQIVILPTYNEALNVATLISSIKAVRDIDILIVDDNSPDGTAQIVSDIARQDPSVRLMSRSGKLGLASAYLDGFKFALKDGYELILQMDCDFSHDPAYILDFMDRIGDNDLVVGSKYTSGGAVVGLPASRRLLSKYGNIYITKLLKFRNPNFKLRDATSGYMCWRAELLRRLPLDSIRCAGYGFLIELKWHAVGLGARVEEIPIVFKDRTKGQSKLSPNIVVEAIRLPFKVHNLR